MTQFVSRVQFRPWRSAFATGICLLLFLGGWSPNCIHAQEAGEIMESAEITLSEESLNGGRDRRETLLASLTIFLLAVFLGFELITKVPPTLHTPLMSGSNAISGITLVGAVLATGTNIEGGLVPVWGLLAVIMATVNVVGGFAVTHRMLAMFRRK